jgi:hypothetical protein
VSAAGLSSLQSLLLLQHCFFFKYQHPVSTWFLPAGGCCSESAYTPALASCRCCQPHSIHHLPPGATAGTWLAAIAGCRPASSPPQDPSQAFFKRNWYFYSCNVSFMLANMLGTYSCSGMRSTGLHTNIFTPCAAHTLAGTAYRNVSKFPICPPSLAGAVAALTLGNKPRDLAEIRFDWARPVARALLLIDGRVGPCLTLYVRIQAVRVRCAAGPSIQFRCHRVPAVAHAH